MIILRKSPRTLGIVAVCVFSFAGPSFAAREEKNLDGGWKLIGLGPGSGLASGVFKQTAAPAGAIDAVVPGGVQTALERAGRILDPYVGWNNEQALWTDELEWWFFKSFTVPPAWKGRWIELQFDGLNYQGAIFLNGRKLADHEGQFVPQRLDVTQAVRYGAPNHLWVVLRPPPGIRAYGLDKMGRSTGRALAQLYMLNMASLGWDWAPHLFPVGLWRPVRLVSRGPVGLAEPWVRTRLSDSYREADLTITAKVTNHSATRRSVSVSAALRDPSAADARTDDASGVSGRWTQKVDLAPGEAQEVRFEVHLTRPRLWWPNGVGPQNLYALDLVASDAHGTSDRSTVQFGIRDVKFVPNEGPPPVEWEVRGVTGRRLQGQAYDWTLQVNGRKVFSMGSNWIPPDSKGDLSRGRYEHLLKVARDAGMNTLRVWGGGLMESDEFYELTDRYGIVTWQEFMSNKPFGQIDQDVLFRSVEETVLRLRNHPSLILWGGGNEFNPDDKAVVAIVDRFDEMLKRLDPDREFRRASPYKGDEHDWHVWHGLSPHTEYGHVVPFRSESGMSAPPIAENFRRFMPEKGLWPRDHELWEYHQEREPGRRGPDKLDRYVYEYSRPGSIEEFVEESQLAQAAGLRFNLDYCRAHQYQTAGMMWWMYNDAWPAISWSLIDWYGVPKAALHFFAAAARPLHLALTYPRYVWNVGDRFQAEVFLANGTDRPLQQGKAEATILDTGLNVLEHQTMDVTAEANSSHSVLQFDWPIPDSLSGHVFLLRLQLRDAAGVAVDETLHWFAVSPYRSTPVRRDLATDWKVLHAAPPADLAWTAAEYDTSEWKPATLPIPLSRNDTSSALFRTTVQIPEEWRGTPLEWVGPWTTESDEVYLNGVRLGGAKGFLTPRVYAIPEGAVHYGGKNVVALRVDKGVAGRIAGVPVIRAVPQGAQEQAVRRYEADGAVFGELRRLPQTRLALTAFPGKNGLRVSVRNVGQSLAFATRIVVRKKGLPVPAWVSDNYFSLLPGEEKNVDVLVPRSIAAAHGDVTANAWNAPVVVQVP